MAAEVAEARKSRELRLLTSTATTISPQPPPPKHPSCEGEGHERGRVRTRVTVPGPPSVIKVALITEKNLPRTPTKQSQRRHVCFSKSKPEGNTQRMSSAQLSRSPLSSLHTPTWSDITLTVGKCFPGSFSAGPTDEETLPAPTSSTLATFLHLPPVPTTARSPAMPRRTIPCP